MDKEKFSYFVARYSGLHNEELAQLCQGSDALADDANAALNYVLMQRGITREALKASNLVAPPVAPKPKKNWPLIVAQLIGVVVAAGIARLITDSTPNWGKLMILCVFAWIGIFRFFRKSK